MVVKKVTQNLESDLNMRPHVKIQCKLVNITLSVKTLWGLLNTCDPQRDLKT